MELPDDSPSSDSLSMLNVLGLYRPPSLESLPCDLPPHKCRAWTSRSFPRCLLGALCLVSAFRATFSRSTMWSRQLTVCVCTGVLQLAASGDLPADDRPAVAGGGPGQPGPVHTAGARSLRLLSVSVPRADGGARRTHARGAVTATGTTEQFNQSQDATSTITLSHQMKTHPSTLTLPLLSSCTPTL